MDFDKKNAPNFSYHIKNNSILVIQIEAPNLLNYSTKMKILNDNNVFTFEGRKKSVYDDEPKKEGMCLIDNDNYYCSIKIPTRIAIISKAECSNQVYKKGIIEFEYPIITINQEDEEEEED